MTTKATQTEQTNQNSDDELTAQLNDFMDLGDDLPSSSDEPEGEVVETETTDVGEVETPVETPVESKAETVTADVDENSVEALQARIKLMEERLTEAYKPVTQVVAQPEVKPTEAMDADSLFGEWTFDKIIEDEGAFKKFLGEFATKVQHVTKESIMKDLPTTVNKLTNEQQVTQKIVNDFYDDNKELTTVKPFVAQVVTTVASEHPEWDLPEVLAEASKRSYTALGLKKKVEEAGQTGGKKKTPAFVQTTSSRRNVQNEQKSKLEKDLEELMEL